MAFGEIGFTRSYERLPVRYKSCKTTIYGILSYQNRIYRARIGFIVKKLQWL